MHLQQTLEDEYLGRLVKFRFRSTFSGIRFPILGSERKISKSHPYFKTSQTQAIRAGRQFVHPVEYDYVFFKDVYEFNYYVASALVEKEGQNPKVSLDLYSNETTLIRVDALWMELDQTFEFLDEETTKEQGSIYDIAVRYRRNGQ